MQSPCNLHLAGRAAAVAKNQDGIPQVNGNWGRRLMMPVLLWKSITADARGRIKAAAAISAGGKCTFLIVFIESGFKHNYNPCIFPPRSCVFFSFSQRSKVSCTCDGEGGKARGKRKGDQLGPCVWFAFTKKKKKKGHPSLLPVVGYLLENSLTISTVGCALRQTPPWPP